MLALKHKVDSIRRTLKDKEIVLQAPQIESEILECCPNLDNWCSDVRKEVIKSLIKKFK